MSVLPRWTRPEADLETAGWIDLFLHRYVYMNGSFHVLSETHSPTVSLTILSEGTSGSHLVTCLASRGIDLLEKSSTEHQITNEEYSRFLSVEGIQQFSEHEQAALLIGWAGRILGTNPQFDLDLRDQTITITTDRESMCRLAWCFGLSSTRFEPFLGDHGVYTIHQRDILATMKAVLPDSPYAPRKTSVTKARSGLGEVLDDLIAFHGNPV